MGYLVTLGKGTICRFHEEKLHPCFLVVMMETL